MAHRARTLLFVGASALSALLSVGGCRKDDASANAAEKGASKDGAKDGKSGDPAARPTPVLTAKVETKDVPVWLEGLGTVTAWYQVTVRSQVDGRLDKVFFQEGQAVKKGDLLAQIDPRPYEVQLQTAQGQLIRDTATLKDTTLDYDRDVTLAKTKLVATQVVDDQQALVGQAQGSVKVDEASINSAKLNLDYARVRAPFDGVVGVRLVDPGNIIHATDTTGIVILTQIDPIAVFMTLPQDDLDKVAAAQHRGDVSIEVVGRDNKQKLGVGKLVAIDNQVNTSTSTIRLKASIPNPTHALWPNAFVKARVLVDTQKQALVVPAAAVQHGPDGAFVYFVKADQTAAVQKVDVQMVTGDSAIIKSDLPTGSDVVIEGQNQLRPGAKVSIVQPSGVKQTEHKK